MAHNDDTAVQRMNTLLKAAFLRHAPEVGLYSTEIEGLRLARRHEASKPEHCLDRPLISLLLQGSKRALMGSSRFEYSENQCLVVGVDMPNTFQVPFASPEQPFLGIALYLDKQLTSQLMLETDLALEPEDASAMAFSVADAGADLLDAFLRLVQLLDTPQRISILAPMILREIHYLLLTGPQGAQLRRINTFGTQSNQVARAISWMRNNYMEPVQIDTLARTVNMGTSTFHRHFKEVTSISPLQYLKRLRLYEAQRMMLAEDLDATHASLAVGYESSTQFNREYKRLFGEPPLRDIKRLR